MVLSGAKSDYETGLARAEDAFETAALDITDTWMILYTSGTTGRPKGARITYGMALFNAVHATSAVALGVDSTNLVFLPTFHAAGLHLYANPILQLGAKLSTRMLRSTAVGAGHPPRFFRWGLYAYVAREFPA